MKEDKMRSLVEFHVCNYKRDHDENCFDKGGKELTDTLKKWAKANHGKDIKVFRSGCLGKCSEGIAIACYPDKKFLLEAKVSDQEEIKQILDETLQRVRAAR